MSIEFTGKAVFDGKYRYLLERDMTGSLIEEVMRPGHCMFLMLNPSKATDDKNDPTVRRCMGYALEWGFAKLYVANLYAFVSTSPSALWGEDDPVGPANDDHILQMASESRLIVCAWGAHAQVGRMKAVCSLLYRAGAKIHALGLTKDGYPKHPLYLKGNLRPFGWAGVR